jgi:hypothetical protein
MNTNLIFKKSKFKIYLKIGTITISILKKLIYIY